jgi:hypothetical protein
MEKSQRTATHRRASDFTRQLNATLSSVQIVRPAPASPSIDIDWTRNVMITVAVDMVAASAAGLASCSACTFAHMCEAADNPGSAGNCHWCEGSSGESYCETNGTACRTGTKPQRTTNATGLVYVGARLGAAVRAAAASGSPAVALTPDEMPIFVDKIETVSSRDAASRQTIYTFRLTNEAVLTVEEHPWWRHLPVALKAAGLPHARTYF